VEDNAKSLSDVKRMIRRRRLQILGVSTQQQFVEVLSAMGPDRPAPDIVILDLRLPWADQQILAKNAIAGGLGCLELLRQEPLTRDVSVVIYSAFVNDNLITSQLAPLGVTIVDKTEPERLRSVVDNMLPTATLSFLDKLSSLGGKKAWAFIIGLATVVGAVAAVLALFAH
jgi:CheY-like chemotaxis protein